MLWSFGIETLQHVFYSYDYLVYSFQEFFIEWKMGKRRKRSFQFFLNYSQHVRAKKETSILPIRFHSFRNSNSSSCEMYTTLPYIFSMIQPQTEILKLLRRGRRRFVRRRRSRRRDCGAVHGRWCQLSFAAQSSPNGSPLPACEILLIVACCREHKHMIINRGRISR